MIYIPIWLDLLSFFGCESESVKLYLHSNMVRFIIFYLFKKKQFVSTFTFQYG